MGLANDLKLFNLCKAFRVWTVRKWVYNCDTRWEVLSFFHIGSDIKRAGSLYSPTYWTWREQDLIRDPQMVCLPVLPEFQRATKRTNVDQKVRLWRQIMWMCYSTTMWMRQYKWCAEFKSCLSHKYLWDKNWIIVLDGQKHWDSRAHPDFSTRPSGHFSWHQSSQRSS